MTNAFTIPKKSSILEQKGARLTFSSKLKKRPAKMVSLTLPGSSKTGSSPTTMKGPSRADPK